MFVPVCTVKQMDKYTLSRVIYVSLLLLLVVVGCHMF